MLVKSEERCPDLPDKPSYKLFILAGSSRQACDLARERGYTDWSYVSSPQDLRGMKNVVLVVYGDAALRDDYAEVIAAIGSCPGSSVGYA